MTEIWTRPWALLSPSSRTDGHRSGELGADFTVPKSETAAVWVYGLSANLARVNKAGDYLQSVVGFDHSDTPRRLGVLPIPKRMGPIVVEPKCSLRWEGAPERPSKARDLSADERQRADLLNRTDLVFDRLAEVETALADPITLWAELHRRWTGDSVDVEPRMDLIVRQAREMKQDLEFLDRTPRRILRRTHKMTPLSRIQEMDRRAMVWLIRQPGDTLAERAGDAQRILGVAREENFDTLENRVLRAYCELAGRHAREYLGRYQSRSATRRYRIVKSYASQCQRLARKLSELGVRVAEPSVTPNYVLLENFRYHKIWVGWHELLDRNRVEDELWRWQMRSWEEFTALAVMVAVQSLPGAKLVAASPVEFLDGQNRGRWIGHENPLGVFHLPAQKTVIEVQYELARPGTWRADFAAPIWLRFGTTDDALSFQNYVPIWPIWSSDGGLEVGEAAEMSKTLSRLARRPVRGGMILRPAPADDRSPADVMGGVASIEMGVVGDSLRIGLHEMSQHIMSILAGRGV